MISPAQAGDWRFTPVVDLSLIATDNVEGASGSAKESDLITRVAAGANLSGQGARATLNFNYRAAYDFYADHSELNGLSQNLAAQGNAELVEESIFIDGSASIARLTIDRSGEVSAVDRNTGSNQQDVYVYSVSPYWRHRYGSFAESELRVTRSQSFTSRPDSTTTTTAAQTNSASDTESNGISAALASGADFNALLWRLTGSATNSKRALGKAEFRTATATLQYNLSSKFGLLLDVGYDEIEDVNLTEDVSGPYALAGFIWTPSERSRLRVQAGRRYSEISFSGDLEFDLTRRTRIQARYSQDVGLALDQFLGALRSTELDPRGRFVDRYTGLAFTGRSPGNLPITDNVTKTSTFTASMATSWTRNSLLVSFIHAEQDSLTNAGVGTATGPGVRTSDTLLVNFTHALTRDLGSSLSGSYSEASGSGGDGGSDQTFRATASLSYTFSDTLTGSLAYSYLQRDSSGGTGLGGIGTGDVTENSIIATLRKSF